MSRRPPVGALFSYDWDALGHGRLAARFRFDTAGFDLFSFPDNARLAGFDLARFAARQARRGARRGWTGVVSHQEQFGALAAALVAERLGLPGTAPEAVLAVQHKLHARAVLERVAPEANLPHAPLLAMYGDEIPTEGITYPCYVKPVKAAFSVLARSVACRGELQAHTRFGRRELWVIRRLVEPFDRVCRARLPEAGTAHRMMLEAPVDAPQYNLDGWVQEGRVHALGVVDAHMYPGTQAFMRWEYPSRLPGDVQARALDVARRFLAAIGFTHGMFNMEFFHDAASGRLSVIEFNPRLASQFADLYRRVHGLEVHAMALALARGEDPATVTRVEPVAGIAASLVYRSFTPGHRPPMPGPAARARFHRRYPDALLFPMPKRGHARARDFKWLGSHRYGIVHLDGRDPADLRARAMDASALLGWTAPYGDLVGHQPHAAPAPERERKRLATVSRFT
jgi:biotin carboxylase